MKRRLLLSFAALMIFAGLSHAAFADSLTIALANANQGTTSAGANLLYSAVLTNTTNATIFLNADSFFVSGPLSIDDTAFLNNAPYSLSAGQSYMLIGLFNVLVPVNTPIGTYLGSFSILGGADANASATIGQATFSTTVTPEPSTWLLMGTGLVGIFVFSRRARVQDAVRSTLS